MKLCIKCTVYEFCITLFHFQIYYAVLQQWKCKCSSTLYNSQNKCINQNHWSISAEPWWTLVILKGRSLL